MIEKISPYNYSYPIPSAYGDALSWAESVAAAHGKCNEVVERINLYEGREEERNTKETARVSAETERVSKESERLSAETERLAAELDRQNLYNTVSGKISALETGKASNTELAVERARIDSFTALASGSTTGDAELTDGRVGDDSYTYASIGAALRGQLNAIKNSRVYLLRDSDQGTVTKTLTPSIDLSYVNVFTLKNTSNASGYFGMQVTVDGANTQIKVENTLVNAGESLTFTIPSSEHCFDYSAANVLLKNINGKSCKVTAYCDKNPVTDYLRDKLQTVIVDAASTGNGIFKNIQDAIDWCKRKYILTTNITVFIRNGKYTVAPVNASPWAPINKGSNAINLIGQSRDGVIIEMTNTTALSNKVIEAGGPCRIAHLTVRNLVETGYAPTTDTHNPYCIHNDAAYTTSSEYATVIEDCLLYSEAFNPIGAGLQNYQKQVYKDVECIFNGQLDALKQWGALYVHGPASPTADNCSLVIDGCTLISRNGTKAISLPDVAGSKQYVNIPVTIRRTIGATSGSDKSNVTKATHKLTEDSALNNISAWNY